MGLGNVWKSWHLNRKKWVLYLYVSSSGHSIYQILCDFWLTCRKRDDILQTGLGSQTKSQKNIPRHNLIASRSQQPYGNVIPRLLACKKGFNWFDKFSSFFVGHADSFGSILWNTSKIRRSELLHSGTDGIADFWIKKVNLIPLCFVVR